MIRRNELVMLASVWLNSKAAKSFRNSVILMFGTRLYGILVSSVSRVREKGVDLRCSGFPGNIKGGKNYWSRRRLRNGLYGGWGAPLGVS